MITDDNFTLNDHELLQREVKLLRRDLRSVYTQLHSLVERVRLLEAIPRHDDDESLGAIRDYLRIKEDYSPQARDFIVSRLPAEWRELVSFHGTDKVLTLLAANKSVHDARERLNGSVQADHGPSASG
jgi:hypothetical protein